MPGFPDGTDVTFSLTPLPPGVKYEASIENDFSRRFYHLRPAIATFLPFNSHPVSITP